MRKYFKALFIALAIICLSLGIAACDETTSYNISVSCGDGGEYSLSHENPVPENTQVTLTVTPDDGYTVGDVLINGGKVSLIGNRYIFTVTKAVSISISFEEEIVPPEECSVTVDCGTGGKYSLDPASDHHVGDRVTLTLTPDAGYQTSEVKVNGKAVTFNGNTYQWRLEGDTTVEITFTPIPYTATVSCGYGGEYELSKQAPYSYGDEVTLTVTADGEHTVKSVMVNGTDVAEELVEGKYTFTVSANVEIVISFSAATSRDAYIGTWASIVSSGTLPYELVIEEDSFTFNGTEYPLTATEDGFAFTVTEGEDVYHYSFTLEEVSAGKYLLNLTIIMPDESVVVQTCMKEGVNYSVDFPEELWGDWDAGPSRYPIRIDESGLTIENDKAVVQSYNERTKTYRLLAGGTEYTLVWNEEEETLTLTIVGDASSAAVYTMTIPPDEKFFTEFAGYYYTNGYYEVQIGANGSFTFDGTLCHVYPIDTSGLMSGYNFYRGSKLWQLFSITDKQLFLSDYTDEVWCDRVTGEEAYTITVTCDDNGTYELSSPASGKDTYAAYEEVTINISPAEGYFLKKLTVNGADVTVSAIGNTYKFYIPKDSTIVIEFVAESDLHMFPNYYYTWSYSGTTADGESASLVFGNGRITLTVNGTEYVSSEARVTITGGTTSKLEFTVAFEGLGEVAFAYLQNAGGTAGWFSFSCDTFSGIMTTRTAK